MLQRLVREEAGITMALTVIMIVLIGVMGAGLLVFVQGDLKSVIEVNQGQKALEAAEAGVQAARRQVLANSFRNQYNDPSLPPSFSPDPANSEWAFDSASAVCGGLPSGPGKCITTAEGDARVAIRYLPPPSVITGTGSGTRNDPRYAPENPPGADVPYPDKRDYFRVDSEGYSRGAYRKIQAIYATADLELPKSYFATKDISLSGNSTTVNNISLFAKGNITGIRSAMLTGTDSAYGDWKNNYNNKARLARSGTGFSGSPLPSATGAAAEGTITYDPSPYHDTQTRAGAADSDRYKRIDFDSRPDLLPGTDPGPANPTPNYRFCGRGTACWPTGALQPADVITYPFKSNAKFDGKLLRSLAQQQVRPGAGSASDRDNYVEQAAGTVTIDQNTFYQVSPALSSVYVVRFTGATKGTVSISPSSGSTTDCPIKGTILVINGDVTTSSTSPRCFDGVISVQDPNNLGTLQYTNIGNFTLNGFVNIEGSMTISGSSNPLLGQDVLNQPGFHTVTLWSWRECYNTTCT